MQRLSRLDLARSPAAAPAGARPEFRAQTSPHDASRIARDAAEHDKDVLVALHGLYLAALWQGVLSQRPAGLIVPLTEGDRALLATIIEEASLRQEFHNNPDRLGSTDPEDQHRGERRSPRAVKEVVQAEMLSAAEVMVFLRVSLMTLNRLVSDGKLTVFQRCPRGKRLFRRADIDRLFDRGDGDSRRVDFIRAKTGA